MPRIAALLADGFEGAVDFVENLVTSRKFDDLDAFCRAFLELLPEAS